MIAASRLSEEVRRNLDEARINLLLAGFPKCGTTSFAHWLDGSPVLSVSNPKETFLLCREHRREGTIAEEGDLAKCFANRNTPYRIEASTLNVYSDVLLNEVRSLPEMKVILSFRDPVESVLSWHNQVLQAGEAIADDFDTCWQRSVECDAMGNESIQPPLSLMQNYARVCKFGAWIQQWRDVLGDERLLIVDAKELRRGAADLRTRLDNFLGMPLALPEEMPVLNTYASIRFESFYRAIKNSFANRALRGIERNFPGLKAVRRTIREKLFRKKARKEFDESLMRSLEEYFSQDVELCRELYQDNQHYWSDSAVSTRRESSDEARAATAI